MRRTVLLTFALVFALAARAAAAESASLSKLDWLAGRWVDDSGGNLSEETWTAPSGDGILGMWRLVVKGQITLSEILTIQAEGQTLVLRLRHFDAKLVGREEKDKPLELTLAGWNESEARFEGPGSDGTGLALTYRHPDADTLACTVEIHGKKEEFTFKRAK
jgi:hypothetical protein